MADPDPTPIERRFLAMIDSLKRSESISTNGEKKRAISELAEDSIAGFSQLKDQFEITLDPALKDCHVRYWELGIHWYAAGASVGAGGEFVLHELVDALMSGPPDADGLRDDGVHELFEQLRVIDYQPEGGRFFFAAVRLTGDTIAPRMWMYHFPYGAFELELDYHGYLEALLLTRGLYHWQFLYTDIRLSGPTYAPIVNQIRTGLDFLKAVQPDPRYAELENRLAERLS